MEQIMTFEIVFIFLLMTFAFVIIQLQKRVDAMQVALNHIATMLLKKDIGENGAIVFEFEKDKDGKTIIKQSRDKKGE